MSFSVFRSSDSQSESSSEHSSSESSSEIEDTFTIKFESDYCDLKNGNEIISEDIEVEEDEQLSLTLTLKEGFDYCVLPSDVRLYFGINKGINGGDYTYENNGNSASLTFRATNDIRIEVNKNDSENIYRISKETYEDSYGLKNVEYAQFYTKESYLYLDVYAYTRYINEYFSPNLYYGIATNESDSTSDIYTNEEVIKPYEQTGDVYIYSNYGEGFVRGDIPTSNPVPTPEIAIANRLNAIFENTVSIPYSALEEHFVSSRLSYVFEFEFNSATYNIEMSFYNNRITRFDSSVITNNRKTKYGQIKIGYETFTPDIDL